MARGHYRKKEISWATQVDSVTTAANGLKNGLVGYWKQDESTGNSADATGNWYTLTNYNVTYAAGKINNWASYNASSAFFISSADDTTILWSNPSAWSFWWWIKSTTSGADQHIMSWYNASAHPWMIRKWSSDKMYVNLYDWTNSYECSTSWTYNDWNWHHWIAVFDKSINSMKLYLDGDSTPIASADITWCWDVTVWNYLYVGTYRNTGSYFWGMTDELCVWNRALSATEVWYLYNGWAGLPFSFIS